MGPLGTIVVFLIGSLMGIFGMFGLVVAIFVLPLPRDKKAGDKAIASDRQTSSANDPTTMADSTTSLTSASSSLSSSFSSVPSVGAVISGPGLDPTFPDVRASLHPFPEETSDPKDSDRAPPQIPAMPLNQYVQSVMAAATQRAKLLPANGSRSSFNRQPSRGFKGRQSDGHSESLDRVISLRRQVADFTLNTMDEFSAIAEEPEEYRYALHVKVESAQGLIGANKNGLSDPFCKLRVGAQRVKTRWVSHSVDPVWNESFSLNVNDPEEDTLLLEIFDHEKVGNNKPLGSAIVSLKCLVRGSAATQTVKLGGIAKRAQMDNVPATGSVTIKMLLTDPAEKEAVPECAASGKKSKLLKKLDRKEEREKMKEEKLKLREEKSASLSTVTMPSIPTSTASIPASNNIDLSPYLQMNREPIKEGMLEIKSLGIWHKRWFVLYENGLLAYHKPNKKNDSLGDCFGLLVLDKCRTTISKNNRKREERIVIENVEKRPIFSTHSVTGKKLTSALAHHRGKAHDCLLRAAGEDEDAQRWLLALRFATKQSEADPLAGLGEGESMPESVDIVTSIVRTDEAATEEVDSDDGDEDEVEDDDDDQLEQEDEPKPSSPTASAAAGVAAVADVSISANAVHQTRPRAGSASAATSVSASTGTRANSGPLLPSQHGSLHFSENLKAKEAKPDVAPPESLFASSGGRQVQEGVLKIQTTKGWAKYSFVLYANGHLAYFHPDFEEPLGLIALRDCQVVSNSPKTRPASATDKSYLEFQIVHRTNQPIFVDSQSSLGLHTVQKIKAGLSAEMVERAGYGDMSTLYECRLRAKNHQLFTQWTTAIRDEITLQTAREQLVGLDAFGGKEEKIDDDFVGYANLLVTRVFQEMRMSAPFKTYVLAKVQRKLAPLALPRFLAPLRLEIDMGGPMRPVGKGARFTHLGHQFLLEMDIDYGGNGINLTFETGIITGLSYAPIIPIRIRVEVLSLQGQFCVYAGEELQTPIFVCFKSRPSIRLDVQVHVGRALRLDWLPHFQRVVSLAVEKGIEKKMVYPARMECFIPFPGRKLDVDLVGPASPIVVGGAGVGVGVQQQRKGEQGGKGGPKPKPKKKKIWDVYTYLDPKKNKKKIKVVAQFIDEILNKADYSRIKALFSEDCVLSDGAGGVGGTGTCKRGAGYQGVQDLVSLIHNAYPGIAFYIECVLVDDNTVLCQFKARSAEKSPSGATAEATSTILQGFFISRVEKKRITEQQHYWSLTAIKRHQGRVGPTAAVQQTK